MAKSSTSFAPGQSGNREGRPTLPPEVRTFLAEKTLPALQRLWAICDCDGHEDQVAALRIFLGKCLPDMKTLEGGADDLQELLLALLARMQPKQLTEHIDSLKEHQ